MNRLIGIRGHRGAGKESVAFLLGNTLELLECDRMNDFDQEYEEWVKMLVDDKDDAFGSCSLNFVYFDSFGDSPKILSCMLLGCSDKYSQSESWKDNAFVDIKTFKVTEEKPDSAIYTAEELNELISNHSKLDNIPVEHIYMSLREFILYFGRTVMQRYFGNDVWVKSTARSFEKNSFGEYNGYWYTDDWRIIKDLKAPTEVSYVIDRGGYVIDVERKGRKKRGGLDLLKDDKRYDIKVVIKDDDLMSIKNEILDIAKKLYDKCYENEEKFTV